MDQWRNFHSKDINVTPRSPESPKHYEVQADARKFCLLFKGISKKKKGKKTALARKKKKVGQEVILEYNRQMASNSRPAKF